MMDIEGLSVIERVYRQALLASPQSITVATDSQAIAQHVSEFGAQVTMTSPYHQTGTDRIAEVIQQGSYADEDIIVNVQGDEPFIHPKLIVQVARSLSYSAVSMATLCWPIEDLAQLRNPNTVKVVRNQYHRALYFSRAAIPAHRDDPDSISLGFRHIGLYAYRAGFLRDYHQLPVCEMELCEALEQLRVLWAGHQIQVEQACVLPLQDINTHDDLILAREWVKQWSACSEPNN